MNKSEFEKMILSNKLGESFLDFFINYISSPFKESYNMHLIGKKSWKTNNIDFSFSSVYDAFQQYYWPVKINDIEIDFTINQKDSGSKVHYDKSEIMWNSTVKLLENYGNSLDSDILENKRNAIIDVFKWGGVYNTVKNKREFQASGLLDECCVCNLESVPRFIKNYENEGVFKKFVPDIDSGLTKVYSFAFNNFIIYDSRVGASLGDIVRRYCIENCIGMIPEHLNFAYMDAQNKKLNRNPSFGSIDGQSFNKMGNSKNHWDSNLRANWLFEAAFKDTRVVNVWGKNNDNNWRRLEAALFVLGYDLN